MTSRNARLAFASACLLLLAGLVQTGCTSLRSRHETYTQLARASAWHTYLVATSSFDIAAAAPQRQVGAGPLVVYLEGDGRAYLNPYHVSPDPTPISPLALRLAVADGLGGPKVYLARPCQYTMPSHGRNCEPELWTTARYSASIIGAISEAIDQAKHNTRSEQVLIVGYSGGGALAVILAAQRRDVVAIVTVAANLDLAYWTQRDGLANLDGSLDPADFANAVSGIPQLHFAGAKDDVVGPDVVSAFLARMAHSASSRLVTLGDYDHECCWADAWPQLLRHQEAQKVLDRVFPP